MKRLAPPRDRGQLRPIRWYRIGSYLHFLPPTSKCQRTRQYVFKSAVWPSVRPSVIWPSFCQLASIWRVAISLLPSEVVSTERHRYLSCEWALLKKFSRSEVKGQGHD